MQFGTPQEPGSCTRIDASERPDDEGERWSLRRRSKQVRTRPIDDAPATEEHGADALKDSRHRRHRDGRPNKVNATSSDVSVVRAFDAAATRFNGAVRSNEPPRRGNRVETTVSVGARSSMITFGT